MKFTLKNIEWDIDDDDDVELPTSVELEIEGSGLENLSLDELEDYGFSDYLSDKYGYCVRTFDFEEL